MNYRVCDVEGSFDGVITENLGGGEYMIRINDADHRLKILEMSSRGIEFILDQSYHRAKYLDASTSGMELVIDNVPVTLNMHTHFDEVVYKNSGGGGSASAQTALKSQIPGKVVSVDVSDGAAVKKGDVVCTLESMKMQVAVKAHRDGTAKSVTVKEGDTVAKGDLIAEIE
ncbi:MAG: biotin/lipoyl-binding protein [Nitrosopumilus sp. H13]|nr:MAG: biotin/lipoyl-binding protein [Nitrosopumilus sp. H13]